MKVRRLKMSDAVTAKIMELAKKARGTLKVGFIDSDQAPIAFYNEFGHKGRFPAPPRPFFRTMVANESPQWPERMAEALRHTKMDGQKALALMGEDIDGALKQSIRDLTSPPLSPVTLRLRYKFGNHPEDIRLRDVYSSIDDVQRGAKVASGTQAKPLVWTGQMLNSTTYKVEAR